MKPTADCHNYFEFSLEESRAKISHSFLELFELEQRLSIWLTELYKVKRVKLKLSFCGLIAREVEDVFMVKT